MWKTLFLAEALDSYLSRYRQTCLISARQSYWQNRRGRVMNENELLMAAFSLHSRGPGARTRHTLTVKRKEMTNQSTRASLRLPSGQFTHWPDLQPMQNYSQGILNHTGTDIFNVLIPQSLIFGMVRNDAYNGHLAHNPINFQLFDLQGGSSRCERRRNALFGFRPDRWQKIDGYNTLRSY